MIKFKQYRNNTPKPVDFNSFDSILHTDKAIMVGRDKVRLDPNKGLSAGFILRGSNSTGYSSVTVIDPYIGGVCKLRTFIDVGNATVTSVGPGEDGQELYLKIDNDTDGNRTINFGSQFKVSGPLTGSTAATAILHFISDGTAFWEVSRTTGINQ